MTPAPRLLLVTDATRIQHPLFDLVAEAVAGGVDAVYLRHLTPGDDWAGTVAEIRNRVGSDVLLMLPVAFSVGAKNAGRHLREQDPIPRHQRSDKSDVLSRSVHSPREAQRLLDLSYLVAGHVFPTASKPDRDPIGLEGLTSIVAAAPCPIVAIGGITPGRVAAVIEAGAQGVAVISAIRNALDPRAAARELRAAVDTALALQ